MQAEFAAALLDPGKSLSGLVTPNGSDPMVRFGVYRNNSVMTWRKALADQFPVCRQLVGDDFFTVMSDLYMQQYPPTSPIMYQFGAHMADFIAGFAPAATVAYLSDVARLEYQRIQLAHAADSTGIAPDIWAVWLHQPDLLVASVLILSPAICIIDSDYAILDIWAAHQDTETDWSRISVTKPQSVLVWRQDWRLITEAIDRSLSEAIRLLQTEMPLGEILAQDHYDWQQILAFLMERRLINDLRMPL